MLGSLRQPFDGVFSDLQDGKIASWKHGYFDHGIALFADLTAIAKAGWDQRKQAYR